MIFVSWIKFIVEMHNCDDIIILFLSLFFHFQNKNPCQEVKDWLAIFFEFHFYMYILDFKIK